MTDILLIFAGFSAIGGYIGWQFHAVIDSSWRRRKADR